MPMHILVSWYVLLEKYGSGYGSYVCLLAPFFLFSFLWRSFAVVDEASRTTCCRGSRVSFTFVHVVAATLQPVVTAQADSGQLI